ncbi:unnamed protein product, partial [Bubo scandiacus]
FKHSSNSSQAAMTVSGLGEASQVILLFLHCTVVTLKKHLCSSSAPERCSCLPGNPKAHSESKVSLFSSKNYLECLYQHLPCCFLSPLLSLSELEQNSIVPD